MTRWFAISLSLFFGVVLSAESMKTLFQFTGDNPDPAWEATNDGVMGGLSRGGAQLVDQGMSFTGSLSLENNGGFSSVYARVAFNLSDYDGIRLRLRGDGRTYQLRLNSDAIYRNRGWVSFYKEFATLEGEWTEIFVPFDKLKQSWRGRQLSGYTFDPSKVERIGVMLADKQAGEFHLKLRWLAADKVDSD